MQSRDPFVKPTAIEDLRPTQITVGMREVAMKQREWRQEHGTNSAEFLGRHMIPVVIGPKNRPYVIDHHDLALALHREGVKHILTTTVSAMSHLPKDAFWVCWIIAAGCIPSMQKACAGAMTISPPKSRT